jgi:macrodomain Ter protein organizer (MatP/YcbG family)
MNIMKGEKMVTEKRSLTLNTDVTKKVEELAKKEGRSFSNMVQRILQEYFKMMRTSNE